MLPDRLLNEKELAVYFGVSKGSIYLWKKAGMPFLRIGSNVRYDLAKVMEWVEQQQNKVTRVEDGQN